GNTIHTVVSDGDLSTVPYPTEPADLERCGVSEGKARAKYAALKRENAKAIAATVAFPVIREAGVEKMLCDSLLSAPLGDGDAYTTVASFDLLDDHSPTVTQTIQSRPGAVFASTNALYLSVVHQRDKRSPRWYSFYRSVDELSDVHKFRIGERPSDTQYLGSGVVPGHVLNQFSMDEYYGYLRIATTRGRVPDPDVRSSISILAQGEGGNLVRVGAVDGIARGEDIRAVRFDDDRGYIVTFKKTDPLFVADLYQPAHPLLLGELKIPGFSTYLHRLDPDHLLSIGLNADDEGEFAFFNGMLLQIFDVRNALRPRLLFKEKIGTRGSSSEAITNHLAFNYFPEKGLLAIPATVCEGGGEGRFGELSFSGLLVYRMSVQAGFQKLGAVDHGGNGVNCRTWWSHATSLVKRSIFLDDLVYSISDDDLKVQRLSKLGTDVATIGLTE
ncbi:MAG TPA: beta-propeller domain-containing protein, partial [Polyangiaceae bacterium]|nr:beta-propeller domain-containing protein [Polyangiaceae bacterium]